MKDYVVKTGSINGLKGVVELDKTVFGISRTLEEIEDKLKLQKDVHVTIATVSNGKMVGDMALAMRRKANITCGVSRFCQSTEEEA